MQNNRVQLIGYVGKDITASKLENGKKRVALRVSTHYAVEDPKGVKTWHTVWHDVVAWDQTAEFAERSFVKGSKILVEGAITYHRYPDQQGHIRYLTQIRAKSLLNLDR